MIRIAAIAVIAAMLAAWVKTVKPEYALWLILAAGVFLGISAVTKLACIVEELTVLQKFFSGYGAYLKLLLKIIGITYLAEFSSAICKDAGANALASQIELFGKLSILVICMPILVSLLEIMDSFLGG